MKIAVMAAAVFAVSLAGSTAVAVLTKGDDEVGADSLSTETEPVDSLVAEVAHAEDSDSTEHTTEESDTLPHDTEAPVQKIVNGNMDELAALVDMSGDLPANPIARPGGGDRAQEDHSEVATPVDAPPAAALEPEVPEIDPEEQARVAAERKAESARQLARVFSSMQAQEAAEVLRHLRDDEVVEILGNLGSRKSAQILSALSSTRAATLSRLILEGDSE